MNKEAPSEVLEGASSVLVLLARVTETTLVEDGKQHIASDHLTEVKLNSNCGPVQLWTAFFCLLAGTSEKHPANQYDEEICRNQD